MYKYFLLLMLLLVALTACAPKKQLTYEEMLIREAQEVCEADATKITDPPHNSNGREWDSYFTMCMKTRYGYTNADLKKLWY